MAPTDEKTVVMMEDPTGRSGILRQIRRSLGASRHDEERRRHVRERLEAAAPNLIPARASLAHTAQVALFQRMIAANGATIQRITGPEHAAKAITEFLRANNLPARVRQGRDRQLEALGWDQGGPLERNFGPAVAGDEVGLSRASFGIAETGTLVMTSGPENPTSICFLPETHIVMLWQGDIVGTYEDVWSALRDARGGGELPRTVNLIGGPSRTADIEQTMIMGAHGPRRLHLVLVED